MKILVTGSSGFIGTHVVRRLLRDGHEVFCYDRENTFDDLHKYVSESDGIIHLAGENRPQNPAMFNKINGGLTKDIVDMILDGGHKKPLVFASSIQAELDNPYGVSKRMGELAVEKLSRHGYPASIFRFPNVFGKGCRPFYNSVVATWCHLISHDQETRIDDPNKDITLIYVDDVVDNLIDCLVSNCPQLWMVPAPTYSMKLGELHQAIIECRDAERSIRMVNQSGFMKKLYATYLSYVDDVVSYIDVRREPRGSFNELLRLGDMGQVSINTIAPHMTKGVHYHETKLERFIFVSGKCIYRFWKPGEESKSEKIEAFCGGNQYICVDVKPGYVHSIENIGDDEAVMLIWASEEYDPEKPDTYRE